VQFYRAMGGRVTKSDPTHALLFHYRIFEDGRWRKAALYDRALLRPGNRIAGPAVVTELSATTYLPTGWTAAVDAHSNLILTPHTGGRR
jgi:N-methylhydantoinase A/oxoprolinase/acetone carboxylase beta subunit